MIMNQFICVGCGHSPKEKKFTQEHIIPNWLQRHCNLHSKEITLPNLNRIPYSRYKLPMCLKSNSIFGNRMENKVKNIFRKSTEEIIELMKIRENSILIKCWLTFIFLKIHANDFRLKEKMKEKELNKIGERYDLHYLHHIGQMARNYVNDTIFDDNVFGSFIIGKISEKYSNEDYDYVDLYYGRTIYMRVKDFFMIYVVDDGGAAIGMLEKKLENLPRNLNDIQVIELVAEFAAANLHIKNLVTFKTKLNQSGKFQIECEFPKFEIFERKPEVFGKLFRAALGNKIICIKEYKEDPGRLVEEMDAGRISTIWREDGSFAN
jgi:hypothetical protein